MSATDTSIEHVIPQVGLTRIRLYPPADRIYRWLKGNGEVNRLNRLRHLGALTHALPGARHARWDYTAALAYYAEALDVPGMNSQFRLGPVTFSSAKAALQVIALCWNVGHLPGIFPVEKGVYRFLYEENAQRPANALRWPDDVQPEVSQIRKEANRFLREEDYLGVARVLAVAKLLGLQVGDDHELRDIVCKCVAPFLLSYETGMSKQWHKLRRAFTIVRHAAYLTLDMPLSGLAWCPSIPSLWRQQLDQSEISLENLSDCLCEILSPIEHMTYPYLYHREAARLETAVVANWIHTHLQDSPDPAAQISTWMGKGLFRELRIGGRPSRGSIVVAGSIRLRTHFVGLGGSTAATEALLKRKKFPLPLVLEYRAWNSETTLEPDELIIDGNVQDQASPDDVGRLLVWMIKQFENPDAGPDDGFGLMQKSDFERTYVSLLKRAVQLSFPGTTVVVDPWPLARFGLFKEMPPGESRGTVWACDAELGDRIAKHIARDRRGSLPTGLRDQYAELLGIHELRKHLRRKWAGKNRRQRCLLVTASIRFRGRRRDLIEFDGGIVVVSSRSGRIRWYGLESKRGDGDPLLSLQNRLNRLKISAPAHKLSGRYAFVELQLKPAST